MGILDGKKILVTGVLTDSSIAYHVARMAQVEGAKVVLTGYGRLSLVERIAQRLPRPAPVIELDVTNSDHLGSLAERVSAHADGLDGVVHAIAFAPQGALGGNFLNTPWEDVAKAVLESCARYLARDLGDKRIRVNLVAAGPIRTMAAKSIPGFEQFEKVWADRAPLGWDITNPEPAARACVALLSDWFPATTGEIVHVDGGAHAMGC